MPRWPISLCAMLLAGCQIPAGTNATLSGVGLLAEPFGSSPAAPKLAVGSFSQTFSLPAPKDAGPTLNRVQVSGPGIESVSTISQGPVGQEMKAAGDVLPATLKALHGTGSSGFPIPELGPEE